MSGDGGTNTSLPKVADDNPTLTLSGVADEAVTLNTRPILIFVATLLVLSQSARLLRKSTRFGACYATQLKLLSTTLLWYSLSIGLTLYNKFYFEVLLGGIDYPLFLTAFHMALKGVLAYGILAILDARSGARNQADEAVSEVDVEEHDFGRFGYMLRALAVGVCTGLDIAFSNLAIAHFIPLSLHTIVKTSSLIFVYVLSIVLKMQPARWQLTLAVSIVLVGVLTAALGKQRKKTAGASDYTDTDTELGVLLTVAAAAMGAMRWVLTEVLLKKSAKAKNSLEGKFKLLLRISPGATVSVLLFALPIETSRFCGDPRWAMSGQLALAIGAAALGGVTAVGLLFAELGLVHMASALTLAVVGHLKEVLVVVFAIVVFAEPVTAVRCLGMVIAFGGGTYYIYIKSAAATVDETSPGGTVHHHHGAGESYGVLDEGSVNMLELRSSQCSDNSHTQAVQAVHATPELTFCNEPAVIDDANVSAASCMDVATAGGGLDEYSHCSSDDSKHM